MDSELDSRILAAAAEGRAEELGTLLDAHPDKRGLVGGAWRIPLLHLAAAKGQLACVEALLARGFDVRMRDEGDNATALHWAAQEGGVPVVERLLAAGAELDADDDLHELGPLGWATCFGEPRREVAEALLARGARAGIFPAVALGRADLVRQLAAADPGVLARRMSRFDGKRTALHLAVARNLPEMVGLLLDLGAALDATDDRGLTPLHYITGRTDPRIRALLVAAGADPSEAARNHFESAIPILNVANVPASIDYYVEKLAFTRKWEWGSPPTFACVGRDRVEIFLCQGGQGAPGTWMSIFVQDVDALHADYVARGAIIKQQPTNFPWGVREMNVADLDGHRLRMGSDATGPADGVALAKDD